MKESKGFVNQYLDNANKFYANGFKQFNFYKKLLGTKVIVRRANADSKYKRSYGSTYTTTLKSISASKYQQMYRSDNTSTSEDNQETQVNQEIQNDKGKKNYIEFDYVIIINLNEMRDVYLKMIEQMEIFDNEDVLKKGDLLIYARKNQMYMLKVVKHDSFSEAEGVLNKYQLTGLIETNSLK